MRAPRSSPRINLRFDSLEEMDHIELKANQDGLTIQSWIRRLIRRELLSLHPDRAMIVELYEFIHKILAMLEKLIDQTSADKPAVKADSETDQLNRLF